MSYVTEHVFLICGSQLNLRETPQIIRDFHSQITTFARLFLSRNEI